MESAADNEAKPLGRILSQERERQGLSRTEVAQRLHMSAAQIEALESGEYSRLPRGPFLRGFVRNYGKLLGVDTDTLLSQLAQIAPRNAAPDIVVPSQNIRFDPMGERLASPYVKAGVLAVVVVALAFAAMYWWLFIRPIPPASQAKKAAAEAPRGGPPQQLAAPPITAPDPVPPSPAPTVSEGAEPARNGTSKAEVAKVEVAREDAAKAETARRAGMRTLQLRFHAESWVEVRDAQGTVLFSRLNAGGSTAEVVGRPPLSVVVGNAPEVEVTYEGRDFPLEPHTKVAVARFTLE